MLVRMVYASCAILMPISNRVMHPWTAIIVRILAGLMVPDPPAEMPREDDPPNFFVALGLQSRTSPQADVWKVAEQPAPFAWMTEVAPFQAGSESTGGKNESFQVLLDRMSILNEPERAPLGLPGVIIDPGRWRYQQEHSGELFNRKTKLELPDPNEVFTPYSARNWKAQQKVQIPVPIPLPVAEQIFVYGQLDGSGDALNNHQANLYGKTGVGLKWLLPARSELQLRYATLLSHSDDLTAGRYQERAQPAVELMARVPLMGPLSIEYTGSAIPAVTRTEFDQLKQELRLALPLTGDNELEFGARYRWEYAPFNSPWTDRAQLFLGVKIRH